MLTFNRLFGLRIVSSFIMQPLDTASDALPIKFVHNELRAGVEAMWPLISYSNYMKLAEALQKLAQEVQPMLRHEFTVELAGGVNPLMHLRQNALHTEVAQSLCQMFPKSKRIGFVWAQIGASNRLQPQEVVEEYVFSLINSGINYLRIAHVTNNLHLMQPLCQFAHRHGVKVQLCYYYTPSKGEAAIERASAIASFIEEGGRV